jgi:hypothetical protein
MRVSSLAVIGVSLLHRYREAGRALTSCLHTSVFRKMISEKYGLWNSRELACVVKYGPRVWD